MYSCNGPKTIAAGDKACSELPHKISENWGPNNKTNDSFLTDLTSKYKPCLLNRDTSEIISLFGKKFYLQTAVLSQGQRTIDSLELNFTLEYNVFTPSRPEGGYNCRFFANKKGVVKYFQVDKMSKGKFLK